MEDSPSMDNGPSAIETIGTLFTFIQSIALLALWPIPWPDSFRTVFLNVNGVVNLYDSAKYFVLSLLSPISSRVSFAYTGTMSIHLDFALKNFLLPIIATLFLLIPFKRLFVSAFYCFSVYLFVALFFACGAIIALIFVQVYYMHPHVQFESSSVLAMTNPRTVTVSQSSQEAFYFFGVIIALILVFFSIAFIALVGSGFTYCIFTSIYEKRWLDRKRKEIKESILRERGASSPTSPVSPVSPITPNQPVLTTSEDESPTTVAIVSQDEPRTSRPPAALNAVEIAQIDVEVEFKLTKQEIENTKHGLASKRIHPILNMFSSFSFCVIYTVYFIGFLVAALLLVQNAIETRSTSIAGFTSGATMLALFGSLGVVILAIISIGQLARFFHFVRERLFVVRKKFDWLGLSLVFQVLSSLYLPVCLNFFSIINCEPKEIPEGTRYTNMLQDTFFQMRYNGSVLGAIDSTFSANPQFDWGTKSLFFHDGAPYEQCDCLFSNETNTVCPATVVLALARDSRIQCGPHLLLLLLSTGPSLMLLFGLPVLFIYLSHISFKKLRTIQVEHLLDNVKENKDMAEATAAPITPVEELHDEKQESETSSSSSSSTSSSSRSSLEETTPATSALTAIQAKNNQVVPIGGPAKVEAKVKKRRSLFALYRKLFIKKRSERDEKWRLRLKLTHSNIGSLYEPFRYHWRYYKSVMLVLKMIINVLHILAIFGRGNGSAGPYIIFSITALIHFAIFIVAVIGQPFFRYLENVNTAISSFLISCNNIVGIIILASNTALAPQWLGIIMNVANWGFLILSFLQSFVFWLKDRFSRKPKDYRQRQTDQLKESAKQIHDTVKEFKDSAPTVALAPRQQQQQQQQQRKTSNAVVTSFVHYEQYVQRLNQTQSATKSDQSTVLCLPTDQNEENELLATTPVALPRSKPAQAQERHHDHLDTLYAINQIKNHLFMLKSHKEDSPEYWAKLSEKDFAEKIEHIPSGVRQDITAKWQKLKELNTNIENQKSITFYLNKSGKEVFINVLMAMSLAALFSLLFVWLHFVVTINPFTEDKVEARSKYYLQTFDYPSANMTNGTMKYGAFEHQIRMAISGGASVASQRYLVEQAFIHDYLFMEPQFTSKDCDKLFDFELAGYSSWQTFTESCCCASADVNNIGRDSLYDMMHYYNGSSEFSAVTSDKFVEGWEAEKWTCNNGKIKTRLRKISHTGAALEHAPERPNLKRIAGDAVIFIDGYQLRHFCAKNFTTGVSQTRLNKSAVCTVALKDSHAQLIPAVNRSSIALYDNTSQVQTSSAVDAMLLDEYKSVLAMKYLW